MPLFSPVLAMHIPDGFLSLPVCAVLGLVALVMLAVALKQVERTLTDRLVPLMGVSAAFIFAAQMINFPIPLGGTSGHLLGGTLAAILLGPWAGALAVMVVFIVQALLFQDGGITALGANLFNMGFVGTFLGYYVYRSLRSLLGKSWFAMAAATAVASWLSVVAASAMAAFELAISGTANLSLVLPAMVGVHALIGIGEAVLTVGVVSFLWRTRSDLLFDPPVVTPPVALQETLHGR